MKFKLIKTVQTANGLAFQDLSTGNIYQALPLFNVTRGHVVFLPMTIEVCKSVLAGSAKHKGKAVIDDMLYERWLDKYSIEDKRTTDKRTFRSISEYVKKQAAKLYRGGYQAVQTQDSTKASYLQS